MTAIGLAGNVAQGQPAAFTYQGSLKDGGSAANGIYQMKFTMHATETGEAVLGRTITNGAVAVDNGLFTATLDFGEQTFDGSRRWLEIAVATNGTTAFTTLAPRQEIRPAPYAIRAACVDGPLSSNGLAGSYSRPVALMNPANLFVGDGGGLSNVQAATLDGMSVGDFWLLGGNAGTATNSFIGTIDDHPLELRVNNRRALRLESAMNGTVNVVGGNGTAVLGAAAATTIGGGQFNIVLGGNELPATGGTIGGGAQNILVNTPYSTIGGGLDNVAYESFHATISGGNSNTIGSSPAGFFTTQYAFIGGGIGNWIQDGACSLIAGGAQNQLEPFTECSAVVGGRGNTIRASSRASNIGGGEANQILPGPFTATEGTTIAGGRFNEVQGQDSTIAGGQGNQVSSRRWATISGGARNKSGAQGSTIGGGTDNYIFGDDFGVPQSPNATIGGGNGNQLVYGAANATIAGGRGNTVTGSDASSYRAAGGTIAGGVSNLVSDSFGTIPGGTQATADNYGQLAYASGSFATPGDAQTSTYVCRAITMDATRTELFLDGVSRRISLHTNTTCTFEILVSGRAASGDSACYRIWGAAKNKAGVTTLFGKVKHKAIAEDDTAWDARATAPGTDGTFAVQVTGAKDKPVRWVATVRTSEVSY